MKITVKDLKNQTGVTGIKPFLHCSVCQSEFSANAGDYWDISDNHMFTCCGEPLRLVTKHTVYTEVNKRKGER